jgi:hypothetical protein
MTSAPPAAHVVLRGRRRTRLRFTGRRGEEGFLDGLASKLSALPGVANVQTYPLTGSILIVHSAAPASILDDATGAGLFMIPDEGHESGPPFDKGLASAAAPLLVAGALSALAAAQLLRGRVLPPAVTLAWYAATLALPTLIVRPRERG